MASKLPESNHLDINVFDISPFPYAFLTTNNLMMLNCLPFFIQVKPFSNLEFFEKIISCASPFNV